jgi:hypothetical protein
MMCVCWALYALGGAAFFRFMRGFWPHTGIRIRVK